MRLCFLDTETVGFHGLAVLLQYAYDDGDIKLWNIWKEPVGETLDLIREISECRIVGFNLAFDWFHLCKIYTVFSLLDPDDIPEDIVDHIGTIEHMGREGDCLKPAGACDLMLYARKGPYQSLMDRKDIRIKRIPAILASHVQQELEDRIKFDDIYFARRKDQFGPKWKIQASHKGNDNDPEFRDIVLSFAPSGGLKNLAVHALGVQEDDILKFTSIGAAQHPEEYGYAPFATAVSRRTDVAGEIGVNWRGAWPDVIRHHISYWAYNTLGIEYAEKDVDYTRRLFWYFVADKHGRSIHECRDYSDLRNQGGAAQLDESAILDDNDSVLACMVGAVRWRGFKIDPAAVKERRDDALRRSHTAPKDPARVRRWLTEVMDPTEQLALLTREGKTSTAKAILEIISTWEDHPAAERATAVLDARKAKKEMEIYDKLLLAGRFHASFVVIGTLSSRMSGSDGLNPQGINHKREVRACFPLADLGLNLCGGDFDSFEVVLADAVYDDDRLRADLTDEYDCDWCDGTDIECDKCEGTGRWVKKIHAIFAMQLFPGDDYDTILKSKGTDNDKYWKGKQGVFSQIYGGDENTISQKLAISIEIATEASLNWQRRYTGIKKNRERIFDLFCSMRQPGGIGSKVEWHEPADYIESFLGFRRYFTLENKICKVLFELAQKPPTSWRAIKMKVQRSKDREQTVAGAAMSALFAAAFNIQAKNMRAAANHEIQSPGAQITKTVQRAVWDEQPAGVGEWIVVPMNIHDEVLTPTKPGHEASVSNRVSEAVESFRERVPLIRMDWKTDLKSWASK